jgi:hypothetical protein
LEFSAVPSSRAYWTGFLKLSFVIVAPRGVLLGVHMANDHHGNYNDGRADDQRHSYQTFSFHFTTHPADPRQSLIA